MMRRYFRIVRGSNPWDDLAERSLRNALNHASIPIDYSPSSSGCGQKIVLNGERRDPDYRRNLSRQHFRRDGRFEKWRGASVLKISEQSTLELPLAHPMAGLLAAFWAQRWANNRWEKSPNSAALLPLVAKSYIVRMFPSRGLNSCLYDLVKVQIDS